MIFAITEFPDKIWIKTENRELLFKSSGELVGASSYVKRAIIAEDEPDLAISLSDMISSVQECFFTSVANNGQQAFSMYKEFGADLIVTDLEMPLRKGDWLISEIRKINPKVPVILVTAHAEIIDSYEKGEDSNLYCLIKPINPDTLLPIIEGIFK